MLAPVLSSDVSAGIQQGLENLYVVAECAVMQSRLLLPVRVA
jgi:hypothetical protein